MGGARDRGGAGGSGHGLTGDGKHVIWVFGYATLSVLQDVDQSSIYAVAWNLVCGLEVRDFNQEQLRILFHAHLMHRFLGFLRLLTVTYPAWLMKEARDAWMHNVQNHTTVSRAH